MQETLTCKLSHHAGIFPAQQGRLDSAPDTQEGRIMSASFTAEATHTPEEICRVALPEADFSRRASEDAALRDASGHEATASRGPTTSAMAGVLCGVAFAAGLVGTGWPPAVAVPEFTAMLCAGLFSIAGGCIGILLLRTTTAR